MVAFVIRLPEHVCEAFLALHHDRTGKRKKLDKAGLDYHGKE